MATSDARHTSEHGGTSPSAPGPSRRTCVEWAGRFLGPVGAIALYLALAPLAGTGAGDLPEVGRRVAAVTALMAILWVTEALPIAATALIPLVLFPALGVLDVPRAAAPFASPVIFLFAGGFLLALSMEKWNLHRRMALLALLVVGSRSRAMIAGVMFVTATLSMWISNTATAVMMLPIAVTIISLAAERRSKGEHVYEGGSITEHAAEAGIGNFATCLMLGLAYSASIGGLGTLIGTPPNAFLAQFARDSFGREIGFGEWMLVGVPLVVVFTSAAWFVLTFVVFPVRMKEIPGGRSIIRDELRALGPISRGERIVLVIFLCTATAWLSRSFLADWDWFVRVFPPVERITDEVIAMIAALALFATPVHPKRGEFVLDWETAVKLPWGVLILFGGGLALAAGIKSSGLDAFLGERMSGLSGTHPIVMIAAICLMMTFITELTSNTATAATFLPILGGVALAVGIDPLLLCIPATLTASCTFMMPVATPPNAIVYGSGHIRVGQMIKGGFILSMLGVVLITLATLLATVVLDIPLGRGAPDEAPAEAAQ